MIINLIKQLIDTKRPPGPTSAEMKHAMSLDEAVGSLTFAAKLTKKYGEIIYLKGARQYLITGPSGFEYILKTNAKNYTKCNFFYSRMKPLFGESLLVTDGEYWKHRRTISQPAFQMTMIKNYAPIVKECCESIINTLNHTPRPKYNILTLMNSLILKITFKLFCGQSLSDIELQTIGKAVSFGNWHISHSFLIKPWFLTINNLRFYYYVNQLDRILLAIIQQRRQQLSSQYNDLLQLLITAPNETGSNTLSDQEILAEFKTLLLTGHETTACGLTWMIYLLAKYPEHRHFVEQELDEVLNGRAPTLEDCHELTVLRAVLTETFRLYPPIWAIARSNIEEDTIGGYKIPARSLIALNLYALHRNPNHWEKPDTFYPPRFFGKNEKTHHPFAYLPFSTGPRICIASHFAMIESTLVAATLLQHFRFEKIPQTKAHPEPCVSLRPKQGLWMKITSR